MKRSVTFSMPGFGNITGYEGGDLPIDKAAETRRLLLEPEITPMARLLLFASSMKVTIGQ